METLIWLASFIFRRRTLLNESDFPPWPDGTSEEADARRVVQRTVRGNPAMTAGAFLTIQGQEREREEMRSITFGDVSMQADYERDRAQDNL